MRTAGQIHIMRVFDELIANFDRNAGNILWSSDGKMWLIDQRRAFRLHTQLKNPKQLDRCERRLLDAMRHLTHEGAKTAVGSSLTQGESTRCWRAATYRQVIRRQRLGAW